MTGATTEEKPGLPVCPEGHCEKGLGDMASKYRITAAIFEGKLDYCLETLKKLEAGLDGRGEPMSRRDTLDFIRDSIRRVETLSDKEAEVLFGVNKREEVEK